MTTASAVCQEALDDPDLVAHLGAAEHGHERARGVLEQRASSVSHLALPAAGPRRPGRSGRTTAWTLAWARCAAPKASLTYTSASAARPRASSSSSCVSPGSKRTFSSISTSPVAERRARGASTSGPTTRRRELHRRARAARPGARPPGRSEQLGLAVLRAPQVRGQHEPRRHARAAPSASAARRGCGCRR